MNIPIMVASLGCLCLAGCQLASRGLVASCDASVRASNARDDACHPERMKLTGGEEELKADILKVVPLGTPVEQAKRVMEVKGFGCGYAPARAIKQERRQPPSSATAPSTVPPPEGIAPDSQEPPHLYCWASRMDSAFVETKVGVQLFYDAEGKIQEVEVKVIFIGL